MVNKTKEFIMFASRKRRTFIALLTILMLLSSGIYGFAANSKVTASGYTAPTSIVAGKGFAIKGKLSSNVTIKRVEVGIASSKTKWTSYKYDNKSVNAKTFDLARADSKLKFGKLKAGTYYYRIFAHTSDGMVHTVLNQKFNVKKSSGAGASAIKIRYPSSLVQGKGFDVKGTVKATKKIKSITAGVTDANGKWTSVKYTKKSINAKSFNLNKINSKLKFGKLKAGTYYYRISVTTTGGTSVVANKAFKVINAASGNGNETSQQAVSLESSNVSGLKSKGEVELKNDTSSDKAAQDDVVSLSGYNAPGTYKVGKKFTPKGTIKSSEPIQRVEIGIVYTSTNKWTGYKYDNNKINSNTFDVGAAASSLRFDMLAGGEYKYRIYVHTKSGVHVALNQSFKVVSSNKPQEALNWALQIAADNTFNYGNRPATSRVGCYFCGTNKKNKPKGYEKTYVCMTFVHAAYAHGAGDPELLKQCQGGKYCLSLNDSNFTAYSCWQKVGLCKDLKVSDLQPGDVICWYAADDKSGHLAMYAGNGNIVDAARTGWGADSIAIRKGAAARYLTTGAKRSKKSYVMRYRK